MKMKTLMVLALSLSFTAAYGQSDSEERVLNSDPIDVDGYLAEDKPVVDGELQQIKSEIRKQKNEVMLNKEKTKGFKELSKTTEKLSETTEEYIDEKKSAQKEIADYNAKIKCLMDENPGKDCDKYIRNRKEEPAPVVQEVQVAQAAPAPVAEVVAEVPTEKEPEAPFEQIKLIPYAGGVSYNGKVEQLEAEIAAGLRLESNITSRFSMGLGFNFAQLKTDDFANNNGYMTDISYQNNFGASREIQYRSMGLDIYGKFFITGAQRFRPYVGAGLGYNRSTINYTANNQTNFNYDGYGYNFGNEEFKNSYATGQLMVGSEIMVSKTFGMNIEAGYTTGLGNALSSQASQNQFNSPDQKRLRELGEEIINANALSINIGALFIF